MGSAGAGVEDAAAFLERCAPSGDAAYGELKAVLGRLHEPTTRRAARAFLTALRPFCSGGDSLARYGFRIHDLSLLDCAAARPILTADDDNFSEPKAIENNLIGTKEDYSTN
uniref:Uncharacterized protein n=1 Tax=Oryza punctata TaxID=4537 RepID=A0A0E0KXI0_ORYPU